jgi:hypothetical protein
MGRVKNAHKILMGKTEEKRTLGRPKRRWEDNIKVELKRNGIQNVDWIHLVQNRALVNMVMNFWVP